MSGMPSGDSPQKALAYYHYLQAHHETNGPVQTPCSGIVVAAG